MDPVEAWREGVNVQAAYNNPQTQAAVEATLIAMVAKTLRYLDYSRTITADQDIIDAVEHLRLEFPAMKIEEWAIIFHRLKTGQYRPGYERLKLPELVAIFQQYEGERAERREANWGELKASRSKGNRNPARPNGRARPVGLHPVPEHERQRTPGGRWSRRLTRSFLNT